MIVDDIRALRRPVPEDPTLAMIANAHNDALEAAARIVEKAFVTRGSFTVIGVEHPAHPVRQMLSAYAAREDS